jgi:hypothetical protein
MVRNVNQFAEAIGEKETNQGQQQIHKPAAEREDSFPLINHYECAL